MKVHATEFLALSALLMTSPANAIVTTYVNDNFDLYDNGTAIIDADPTHWTKTGDTVPEGSTGIAAVSITTGVSGDRSLKLVTETDHLLVRPRWNRDLTGTPATAGNPMTSATVSFDFNYNYNNGLSDQGGMGNKGYPQDVWIYVRNHQNQVVGQIQVNAGYFDWRFGTAYHLGATQPNVRNALWHNVDIAYDFANQKATYFLDDVQQWTENLPGLLNSSAGLSLLTFENGINGPDGIENNTNFVDNVSFSADIGSQWKVDANGTWSQSGNWTAVVPNASGAIANFGPAITQSRTITVDSPKTVGALNFYNANSYTLSGSEITMQSASGAQINVLSGNHTVASPVTLNDSLIMNVAVGSTLDVTGHLNATASGRQISMNGGGTAQFVQLDIGTLVVNAGTVKISAKGTIGDSSGTTRIGTISIASAKLDITNNFLIADATPSATIRNKLASAFNNGAWTGDGITSSSAASVANSNNSHKTALGYAIASQINDFNSNPSFVFGGATITTPDSVLVRYTLSGDANLDGMVNGSDFTRIALNFNQTGRQWFDGDFNFDGVVNALDFNSIAANFGSAPAPGSALGALVPEPASLSLLSIASLLACRPRRRRTKA